MFFFNFDTRHFVGEFKSKTTISFIKNTDISDMCQLTSLNDGEEWLYLGGHPICHAP